MKTYYDQDKKKSANQLIYEVSKKTHEFDEILAAEFNDLTDIGN